MIKEYPLVSIIVVTYNSAKYVLETLESAKAQTYQNIELIVSDDCSTDNTVEICRKWIEENKTRFVRNKLITVEKNTGIPANCNRGVRDAQGEWVKFIAGDDILMSNSILDNILQSKKLLKQYGVIYSKFTAFEITENGKKIVKVDIPKSICNNNCSPQSRYELALRCMGPSIQTMFFHCSVLMLNGGFDEEFKLLEDWPLYLRLTRASVPFIYLPIETIEYRIHNSSTFNNDRKIAIYSDWWVTNWAPVYRKYVRPNVGHFENFLVSYKICIITLFLKSKLNHFNFINRLINYILCLPYEIYRRNVIRRIYSNN